MRFEWKDLLKHIFVIKDQKDEYEEGKKNDEDRESIEIFLCQIIKIGGKSEDEG